VAASRTACYAVDDVNEVVIHCQRARAAMITQAVTYVHDVHTYGIFMPHAKTLAHRQLAIESRIALVCRLVGMLQMTISFRAAQNRGPDVISANEHRAKVSRLSKQASK